MAQTDISQTGTSDTLSLSAFLPYRLSVLSNTVSKRIADLYEAEFGLSMSQWRLMAVMGEAPGLNATEIVNRTAMDKVAISRTVASLIKLGYAKREASQEDGRQSLLYLTRKGQGVYARIVPMAQSQEREATIALSQDEIDELNRLLGKIADVVSPERSLW